MADDTSTIWSWLKDVCEAQNFANPGWVTPQDGFERQRGVFFWGELMGRHPTVH
jgi:hypothetical protein